MNNINNIGSMAIEDSTEALNDLGESIIKQGAIDIAKQLEIYIKANPDMTVEDLQADEFFQSLAVQPVGETGYTAITDVASLTCRFHASEKVVNLDLHLLAEKLPGFWGVMSKTEGGYPAWGYYDWQESDGTINQKYMHIAIVDAITADGVTLSVAATTYIDEFSKPVTETKNKLEASTTDVKMNFLKVSDAIQLETTLIVIFTLVIACLLGIVFATSITKPLMNLSKAGRKIADGNLNTEMPHINSKDEVGDISATVNLLVGALKYMRQVTDKPAKKKKKK